MYRRAHGASVPGFVDKPSVRPVAAPMPSLSKLAGPSPFSTPSDPLIQVQFLFSLLAVIYDRRVISFVLLPLTNEHQLKSSFVHVI